MVTEMKAIREARCALEVRDIMTVLARERLKVWLHSMSANRLSKHKKAHRNGGLFDMRWESQPVD